MKRCPTCNKTYSDPSLSFCIDDGTPLISVVAPPDETTVVTPAAGDGSPREEEVYRPRDWQPSEYQPPSFQAAPAAPGKTRAWPWVVGILIITTLSLVGVGIAAVLIVPNIMRRTSNQNQPQTVERASDYNANSSDNVPGSNSNTDDSQPDTTDGDDHDDEIVTLPPTDADKVLADLTELEHEWTVANINADKKQLDRILADDYVGMSSDGKYQGKAEYLRTIERDNDIQKWDFEDLKLSLKGDRASLTGVIKLQLQEREGAFRFTDKFVWRDGRWQAVSSEVSRIE